jgi:hypothetical protein
MTGWRGAIVRFRISQYQDQVWYGYEYSVTANERLNCRDYLAATVLPS